MKFNFKMFIIGVLLFVVLILSLLVYENKQIELDKIEAKNILIDEYNFKQLESVKSILDKLDKNSYKFRNLNEFNKKFNQNIKPKKNCYFLSDKNRFYEKNSGNGGYIFGFKLESNKYIEKYGNKYIAYPKYDLPSSIFCFGVGKGECGGDINNIRYIRIISNPCKD